MPGKYRPVSTAEKRAMLEAAGEEWPIGSDGLPKVWHQDDRRIAGGYWTTRSDVRAHSLKYINTPKGRAAKNALRKTEKGRATTRRNSATRKRRLLSSSRCTSCGKPLDCESNLRCIICLLVDKERHAFAF